MPINKTCDVCGSSFKCYPYRKDTSRFCSRQCAGKFIRGKENKNGQHPVVKYSGIHMWVHRHLPMSECSTCGSRKKLHRANISGNYLRDLSDWKVLCVPCHSEFDGNSKIPNSKNSEIVRLRQSGMSFTDIAPLFGVTRKAISKRYYRVTNP